MSAGPLCRPLVLLTMRSDSVSSPFSVYRARRTLLTSNPEFARGYESPITGYSDSASVPAPVMARQVDGLHLQARIDPAITSAAGKVGDFFTKIFSGIASIFNGGS